jgi:predicted carbohydrate-binding protein with CBM48
MDEPHKLMIQHNVPERRMKAIRIYGSSGHATVSLDEVAVPKPAPGLLLFDQADDAHPSRTIMLDPVTNRSHHYWHVFVPGIEVGQIYGYRVEGSFASEHGLRFDPQKRKT